MKPETILLNRIRESINATGRARLVRNNCGFDLERKVRYGLGVGSADLIGVLRGGRAFAIEVKTESGRTSKEQVAWWKAFGHWGGTGGVARSVDEALRLLDEAERAWPRSWT